MKIALESKKSDASIKESLQERFGKESQHKITRILGSQIQSPDYSSDIIANNDVPQELAEIKAYGNAVNPWIPYTLLKFILEIEKTQSCHY